mgnify:FL=1
MAKSKVGGSRAYIRGRIGADVYSVGKDGKGARQQVVRSLAEQVSNPRTSAQMFGRMVMSTVMQAVSALQPIIDHSFDGLPKGQPSISEFIRRNYALVKADAIAHPSSDNAFSLCEYQEKLLVNGPFVLSNGKAVVPASLFADDEDGLSVDNLGQTPTVGSFKAAWGLTKDEYITLVAPIINSTGGFTDVQYCRLSFDFQVADSTALTVEVLNAAAKMEGTKNLTLSISEGTVKIGGIQCQRTDELIVSRLENGVYIHNKATMTHYAATTRTSDIVLPTYPVGSQLFLNGGDL